MIQKASARVPSLCCEKKREALTRTFAKKHKKAASYGAVFKNNNMTFARVC